jgi:hypothetical protein
VGGVLPVVLQKRAEKLEEDEAAETQQKVHLEPDFKVGSRLPSIHLGSGPTALPLRLDRVKTLKKLGADLPDRSPWTVAPASPKQVPRFVVI